MHFIHTAKKVTNPQAKHHLLGIDLVMNPHGFALFCT